MNEQKNPPYYRLLPVAVFGGFLLVWELSSKFGVFPEYSIPSPMSVAHGFVEETRGHLFDDVIASLFRVMFGFGLSVTLGVPFGLWLGLKPMARAAFLPAVNFFRALSPLAWIPFAVIWFQLGDKPAVFLIWISAFFPVVLATMAAVAN
ncbi:MAG: ABC transporter permease, partial [Chthonomonadales bacterium]